MLVRLARLIAPALLALVPVMSLVPATGAPAGSAAAMVRAREHFFGRENVDGAGHVRADRVILSWFSVASFAMAIDGKVVLLDGYVHKGEDEPNYVPTTKDELVALKPEAIFIGHGHFDHAAVVGEVAARTDALVVGTPEHCDQAREQALASVGTGARTKCGATVKRGSAPGSRVMSIKPLGKRVSITVIKHVHSAMEAPDGGRPPTELLAAGPPDANAILMHPPGTAAIVGIAGGGDENGTLLYQFRIGKFSLVWHDSVGPLRERAPELLKVLAKLPPTDVEVGATIGFNSPTNGMRDPVDYVAAIKPKVFYPNHHDYVFEYGMAAFSEGSFRRELARRGPTKTDVRWLFDPYDYIRPGLMTFDINAARFAN